MQTEAVKTSSSIAFWILFLIILALAILLYHSALFWVLLILDIYLLFTSLKFIYEYQRGVKFRFGKFVGVLNPGVRFVLPIIEKLTKVDLRVTTVDIPKQEVMTKDNVPVKVNAVVYFRVENPEKAILKVEDYRYAVTQYAQTALRDVIGGIELDELLANRDKIAHEIKEIVDKETDEWGIDVTAIKMQDVELPENMKRAMARQAEAEREKRATIIKAGGEVVAAQQLVKAATMLSKAPGSLHLRTLQTLNDISPDPNTKIVIAIPIEVLEAIQNIKLSSAKHAKQSTSLKQNKKSK
ncbi:SPFH domain-containing protein [Candidatus Woesearchaeota archaeon]|nr:SPFH domain-containing protein [Candidatus Woesearchaeota archaeon]